MLDAHLQLAYGGCARAQRRVRFATMVVAAEARNW
jgi:hypothetical protein